MSDDKTELEVLAIFPKPGGVGTVRFSFASPISRNYIEIDVPYASDEGPTEGVKEAANYLALLLENLAEQAKAIAQ